VENPVKGLRYRQVDVFAARPTGEGAPAGESAPASGNGLAVFWDCPRLSRATMQQLAVELRQFESAFVMPTSQPARFGIKVFTMEEELDFAGHPLMGAAAVLHEKHGTARQERWALQTNTVLVELETVAADGGFLVTMDQPAPQFVHTLEESRAPEVARWIGLAPGDLAPGLPLEVVSTGLPYLIVPVRTNLSHARIVVDDLEDRLREVSAKFLYVYDVATSEGRTWDNRGLVEDIATGSAAGPVAAYLCRRGTLAVGQELTIHQGAYVGRPSVITARVVGTAPAYSGVRVSGRVNMVASGVFD